MNTLLRLQAATLAARARLNDQTIGTSVKDGLVQLERVVFVKGRKTAEVTPLSKPMPAADAIKALDAL